LICDTWAEQSTPGNADLSGKYVSLSETP